MAEVPATVLNAVTKLNRGWESRVHTVTFTTRRHSLGALLALVRANTFQSIQPKQAAAENTFLSILHSTEIYTIYGCIRIPY